MSVRLAALPDLVDAWANIVQDAASYGIAVGIADYGGFRTEADTAEILADKQADYAAYAAAARAQGRIPLDITEGWDDGSSRPIAPFGKSFHNFGAARDFTVDAHPDTMSDDDAVSVVQELAESYGLRSGRAYGDPRHLELNLPLDVAAKAWAEYNRANPGTVTLLLLAIGAGILALTRQSRGLLSWR